MNEEKILTMNPHGIRVVRISRGMYAWVRKELLDRLSIKPLSQHELMTCRERSTSRAG